MSERPCDLKHIFARKKEAKAPTSFALLHTIRAEHRPRLDLVGTVLAAGGLFLLVYGFSHATGMFGVFLFLTYYLEETLGYSAVKTGLAFLPTTVLLMLTAAIGNTVLLSRISARLLMPLGLALAAVGMGLLTRIGLQSNYAAEVLPSLLLIGFGFGLVFAPAFVLGTFGVDNEDAGVASASINVAQQVGGSIGTSLLNTIAAVVTSGYLTDHAASITKATEQLVQANALVDSYRVVFWVAAAVLAAAAVITVALLRSGLAFAEEDSPTTTAAA